jgi:choline dehydrogenase-like flavoprotein
MFFDRGSRGDYDLWEDLGNPGWGWNGLLPYFKKVRNTEPLFYFYSFLVRVRHTILPTQRLQRNWGSHTIQAFTASQAQYTPAILHSFIPLLVSLSIVQRFRPVIHPSTGNFLAAIKEFGSHVPRDGGSGDALGAFWIPNTLDPSSMTRSYARSGYYNPASRRTNLHLLTSTTATKILFQGKTAVGVQVSVVH